MFIITKNLHDDQNKIIQYRRIDRLRFHSK